MNVFITGVSSGIGNALAHAYLERGATVYAANRREPEDLIGHERFVFESADLADFDKIPSVVKRLLRDADKLDLAVLNSGILGRFGDMQEMTLADIQEVMDINLWANKVIIDNLFQLGINISQIVTISSGASVNGNRGWAGYSISKAALNMLTKLYAQEIPATHFCALAPGLVDSAMQEDLCSRPADERFRSLETIRAKRHTEEMPNPTVAAQRLMRVFEQLPHAVESGDYADIRAIAVSADG